MIEIIPSIISKDFEDFREKVEMVEPFVDRIQIDIMDGIFVPQTTFDGLEAVEDVETDIDMEVHLMVARPENLINQWLDKPISRIIIHQEATQKILESIKMIKEGEQLCGVALNPETPIDVVKDFIGEIDFIQFMTVEPGQYGAPFIPDVLEKVKDFHYLYSDIPIQVDGGINDQTILEATLSGATIFAVGSYIFDSENSPEETIAILQGATKGNLNK